MTWGDIYYPICILGWLVGVPFMLAHQVENVHIIYHAMCIAGAAVTVVTWREHKAKYKKRKDNARDNHPQHPSK